MPSACKGSIAHAPITPQTTGILIFVFSRRVVVYGLCYGAYGAPNITSATQ
jgi:glucose-6-phosphate isomerase